MPVWRYGQVAGRKHLINKQMGRPKIFLEERKKTTARIPESIQVGVQKLCDRLSMDQTEAINDGLLLWLVYQQADKDLAAQLTEQSKRIREKLKRELEIAKKEASTQIQARRLSG